tara:strand:+ start:484 stop:1047 length:564 start_codon:yes stop_codon:yes gene_type:complete
MYSRYSEDVQEDGIRGGEGKAVEEGEKGGEEGQTTKRASAILYCFMAGEASLLSENAESSSDVVNMVMDVLRQMFGTHRVTLPVASVVTRWGSDRFARSAYSYVATGCTGKDYDILAETVSNVLFFAGEHTNRSHPTTCAGAMLSGWREAGKIATIHGRWRTPVVEDLMSLESVWDLPPKEETADEL